MNPFYIFLITARDYIKAPANLVTSLLTPHGWHHARTEVFPKNSSREQKKEILEQREISAENKKSSRNIYLTDLDDTFINWHVTKKSKLQKLKHKFISRPSSEKIILFDGAEDFVKHLNASNVHTAVVSNKDHNKLLAQAKRSSWGGIFDRLIGHDRAHAFTMRKHHYNLPSFLHYNKAALPLFAIEKLLGEKPHKNMEAVNVIFVGDKPHQDIATANALNKKLKEFNPNSSCTSILYNSRHFTDADISKLPQAQKPQEIVKNYEELQQLVDKKFALEKEKEQSKPIIPEADSPQKEWSKSVKKPSVTELSASH